MQKLSIMLVVLTLINPGVALSQSAECEKLYTTCENLVKAQDDVIRKQDEAIEELNDQVTTLELEAEDRDQWYRHPIFWGVVGALTGLATGVGLGVAR